MTFRHCSHAQKMSCLRWHKLKLLQCLSLSLSLISLSLAPSPGLLFLLVTLFNVLFQATAKKLRKTGGEVYAVTLSSDHNLEELKEYTGDVDRIYTEEKIDTFIKVNLLSITIIAEIVTF